MSDVWGENPPILCGRSVATGELVHVDDAPNGKACIPSARMLRKSMAMC